MCARSAVLGAYLNVQINVGDLKDKQAVEDYLARGAEIEQKAIAKESEILEIARGRM